MAIGLALTTSRQTTINRQLHRSLGQLQLSALEFAQEVSDLLDSNPLLDSESENADAVDSEATEPDVQSLETSPSERAADLYTSWGEGKRRTAAGDDNSTHWTDLAAAPRTLRSHLRRQVSELQLTDSERAACEALIDSLDERGYLLDSVEELLGDDELDNEVTTADFRVANAIVRTLDPIGVGATGLKDCLHMQLDKVNGDAELIALSRKLIDDHLEDLAKGATRLVTKQAKSSEKQVRDALALIRSLEPTPGRQFESGRVEYAIPDVNVTRQAGRWVVRVNASAVPAVSVNEYYASALSQSSGRESTPLAEKLREARWLVRSIEQRASTIEKVAVSIVNRQQGYFDHGDIALKPLNLAEVAADAGVHESTVCRVVNSKFMGTPAGLVSFKTFFPSAVKTAAGKGASASAVKAMIRKMIDNEEPAKPISDHALTKLLALKGIKISRRTVTKYRSAMGIEALEMRKVAAGA